MLETSASLMLKKGCWREDGWMVEILDEEMDSWLDE